MIFYCKKQHKNTKNYIYKRLIVLYSHYFILSSQFGLWGLENLVTFIEKSVFWFWKTEKRLIRCFAGILRVKWQYFLLNNNVSGGFLKVNICYSEYTEIYAWICLIFFINYANLIIKRKKMYKFLYNLFIF